MRVYPVVHINNSIEAVNEASHALELGADGVYLIDHSCDVDKVVDTFNQLSSVKSDAFIGVNLLGMGPLAACVAIKDLCDDRNLNRIPDGLWVDDALTEVEAGETLAYKKRIGGMNGMRYLGGISFKYTATFTEDPGLAYQLTIDALERVDTVTTSGAGTGTPPTVEKISAMKHAAGDAGKMLAVASGVSLENIANYKGIIDEVLVASSVETAPYSGVFDTDKLQTFIKVAHNL